MHSWLISAATAILGAGIGWGAYMELLPSTFVPNPASCPAASPLPPPSALLTSCAELLTRVPAPVDVPTLACYMVGGALAALGLASLLRRWYRWRMSIVGPIRES